jgi:hypothetical protein
MKRVLTPLLLATILFIAVPASAQTIGTFRWRLAPLGSVLTLTVVAEGNLFKLTGTESQCGGNDTLPVTGLAVPQTNGQVMLGLTTINERGKGIHTAAYVNLTNFNGTWSDNTGYFAQPFQFNPGTTCPGGLRTDPNSGDVPDGQR